MNNTAKKILIISAAIVLSVVGVLIYYPKIMSPPDKVVFENLHFKDLSSSISSFSDSQSYAYNDSVYNIVTDKIDVYTTEHFLTSEDVNFQVKSFLDEYVPIFSALCYKQFDSPRWSDVTFSAFTKRINELEAYNGSKLSDLEKIREIIGTYYKAREVASFSSFHSVPDAKGKIESAGYYINMPYIKNCSDLVSKLSDVKRNIGNSHYSFLEDQVATLQVYYDIDKEQFLNQVREVNADIKEYEDNKGMYGSFAKDSKSIRDQAADIYRKAMDYYQTKEKSVSVKTPSDSRYGIMAIYPNKVSVKKGFKVKISAYDYGNSIEWESENENIARVTKNGIVEGVNEGTTNVWAKGQYEYKRCLVTVVLR